MCSQYIIQPLNGFSPWPASWLQLHQNGAELCVNPAAAGSYRALVLEDTNLVKPQNKTNTASMSTVDTVVAMDYLLGFRGF